MYMALKVNLAFISLFLAVIICGCPAHDQVRSVVIYTSVDQMYSEPILEAFESETGIRVLPVYDVEASKTTGLVNRLIAEKDNPQADVWWSSEFAQTIELKEREVLASYGSRDADNIPSQYRDPEGFWTGIAGRARLLIINTDQVEHDDYPESILDLLDPPIDAERIGIAWPMFGTTATHAAALYAHLGPTQGRAFFEMLKMTGIRAVDGNSVVRDMVASGQLAMGFTDTDDACVAIGNGDPVDVVFLDQGDDQMGTLIIPGTVALILDGPNPDAGKELVDYLVSEKVEAMLVESGWSHVPFREVDVEPECYADVQVRGMEVNLEHVYEQMELSQHDLSEIFVR